MRPINRYLSTKIKASDIRATDKTIHQIVKTELDRLGHDADLNHIDVSEVTSMRGLFSCYINDLGPTYRDLNPNLSEWDVSNVENMRCMFQDCEKFNCDISNWNVSNVKTMQYMFNSCKKFNQDLSSWNVSSVKNMSGMFCGCKKFNKDISSWNVNNVKNTIYIFDGCPIKEEFKPKFNI